MQMILQKMLKQTLYSHFWIYYENLPSLYWISMFSSDPHYWGSFSWSYWMRPQWVHLSSPHETWPQKERRHNPARIAKPWWNSLWLLEDWGLWHWHGLPQFFAEARVQKIQGFRNRVWINKIKKVWWIKQTMDYVG